jgi:hypothetical protein
VDASLQRGEVEPTVAVDDEFAVEDGAGRQLLDEAVGHLREIAGEGTQLAGLEQRALCGPVGDAAAS